jgi:hypothetical protein
LLALAVLAVNLLIVYIPDLAPMRDVLIVVVSALGLALIGGLTLEDATAAGRDRANQETETPTATEELIRQIVTDALNAIIGDLFPSDPTTAQGAPGGLSHIEAATLVANEVIEQRRVSPLIPSEVKGILQGKINSIVSPTKKATSSDAALDI